MFKHGGMTQEAIALRRASSRLINKATGGSDAK
jgi:hypothetical protein